MKHDPQIQITERNGSTKYAPEIEVTAWWSLSNVDRYWFVEADPARRELEFTDGIRRYDTKYGDVTERLHDPRIPPAVREKLSAAGYSIEATA